MRGTGYSGPMTRRSLVALLAAAALSLAACSDRENAQRSNDGPTGPDTTVQQKAPSSGKSGKNTPLSGQTATTP